MKFALFWLQMPRIWMDYSQFLLDQEVSALADHILLLDQGRLTRTRRTLDRALRALPITQHYRIWPLYLKFVKMYPIPETAVRAYRRHLKVCRNGSTCSIIGSAFKVCT